MKFRTEIDITPFEHSIDHSQSLFLIGSCFASSMGERLRASKFDATTNPFGVLFNPSSIVSAIGRLESGARVEPSELECRDGIYFHYDFHSSFSSTSRQEAVAKMNSAVEQCGRAFERSSVVVITLGTIWTYLLKQSGAVVANCHKMPSALFERKPLSVAQIVEPLSALIAAHGDKRFIFTVSPIRHASDGLMDNMLSKSTLRVAVNELVADFSNVDYFPSFEIMMDDLRDYRFYGRDMVHPTEQAQDYIWSKFREVALSDDSNLIVDRVERIMAAVAHRPFNPHSAAHRQFCRKQLSLIEALSQLDFCAERDYFESQIAMCDN